MGFRFVKCLINTGSLYILDIQLLALCPKIVNGIFVITFAASTVTTVSVLEVMFPAVYCGGTYVLGCHPSKNSPMVEDTGGSTGSIIVVSAGSSINGGASFFFEHEKNTSIEKLKNASSSELLIK